MDDSSKNDGKEPLFRDIRDVENADETTLIPSACMNCFQTGVTRVLLTKIPFYKEVVIMSFKCESCGYENNEIQSAAEIQEKGIRIKLAVTSMDDLNRKVVRSDYTSINIPEVELEIPAQSQKGEITTVEGILDRAIRGLLQDQERRKIDHPDAANTIEVYVEDLQKLKSLQKPFTLIMDDISGNAFIENPNAPLIDHNCKVTYFKRTDEQSRILGLYNDKSDVNVEEGGANKHLLKPISQGDWSYEDLHGEVLQFQTLCHNCGSSCDTKMKLTTIPHFKDVVIMCTLCDICGWKTNEVKSGGGIEEKGVRFEVLIKAEKDLTRDVLKSETCKLLIPELECEVGAFALGGRFTTVEGILSAIKDQLCGKDIIFQDSSNEATDQRFKTFLEKLEAINTLTMEATLVLDDPAGNSYVQSFLHDGELDENLKIIRYERTYEQNEELGLNDIKTENYAAD